ncbi:hypothetical protein [Vreelandella salicampi]|uniref:Uncharacterized protein n=1 Tax=Vreelandella salicampi TaxID=1449798 RepID=A0A7Z0LK02_9GAMM|nr:hypothetical protein [Halomonas salicampi]NYS60318.1 hypothetical protein [Halomonas salicampi]
MQVFVSGLGEAAYRQWRAAFASQSTVECQPFATFCEQALHHHAQADEDAVWVWFYRAPWQEVLDAEGASEAALAEWQHQQRDVLAMRRHLRGRLWLVNADRAPMAELPQALGIPTIAEDVEQSSPPENRADDSASTSNVALPGLFAQAAPKAWELYEMLEAAAWLPEGEPEFRAQLPTPQPAAFHALLDQLKQARRLPEAQAQLATLESRLAETRSQLAETKSQLSEMGQERDQALAAAKVEKQELSEESDLLLAQLHQVQEELEKQFLDGKAHQESAKIQLDEHTQRITALTQKLEQAKAKQAELSTELEKSRQAHKQAETAHAALKAEHQKLKLHQEQQQAQSSQALTQANTRQAELTQSLEASRKALADSEAEQTGLAEENDLLLAQLHQVQEELERYYLANQEFQNGIKASEATLHRARHVISKMAAQVHGTA